MVLFGNQALRRQSATRIKKSTNCQLESAERNGPKIHSASRSTTGKSGRLKTRPHPIRPAATAVSSIWHRHGAPRLVNVPPRLRASARCNCHRRMLRCAGSPSHGAPSRPAVWRRGAPPVLAELPGTSGAVERVSGVQPGGRVAARRTWMFWSTLRSQCDLKALRPVPLRGAALVGQSSLSGRRHFPWAQILSWCR